MDRSQFKTFSPEEQQQYYAENGFVLLPGIVSPEQMDRIAEEVGGSDRYDFMDRWPGSALEELITNPNLIGVLHRCYGEDTRFFKAVYTEWREPWDEGKEKRGRQLLHRDYNPDDPGNGDFRNSCTSWCNVGYYLIDLNVDEGPLWVVPGSHTFAWAGDRGDQEVFAEDARMVLARAGDAVMFHNRTIHAGGVMQSRRPRPSVFYSYRPAWAAPLGTVPEWPEEVINQATPGLRRLLKGQNDGVRVDAFGIIKDETIRGDI